MKKRVAQIALLSAATLGLGRMATQGQSVSTQATRPITVEINVNPTAPPQPTLWQITGKDWGAADQVGQSAQVTISKATVSGSAQKLSVAPISISVFQIPVAKGAQ